jgi:hypothetical protein
VPAKNSVGVENAGVFFLAAVASPGCTPGCPRSLPRSHAGSAAARSLSLRSSRSAIRWPSSIANVSAAVRNDHPWPTTAGRSSASTSRDIRPRLGCRARLPNSGSFADARQDGDRPACEPGPELPPVKKNPHAVALEGSVGSRAASHARPSCPKPSAPRLPARPSKPAGARADQREGGPIGGRTR